MQNSGQDRVQHPQVDSKTNTNKRKSYLKLEREETQKAAQENGRENHYMVHQMLNK